MKSRMIAYLSQPRKDSEETEETAAQAFALEALTKQLYSWCRKKERVGNWVVARGTGSSPGHA